MANHDTDQVVATAAQTLLKPNEFRGVKRTMRFTYTVSATNALASGDTITTQRLPKGARITGGRLTNNACGTSTTLKVGLAASANGTVAADDDAFLAATSMASAGANALATTQALNYGYELTDDTAILLTAGGANFDNGAIIQGDIEYVMD